MSTAPVFKDVDEGEGTMDLVYTVAIGKRRYFWAALLMVRSLRQLAGFTGDIVIFSDRRRRVPKDVRLELVQDSAACAEPKWMKMRARHALDFSAYERVAFIDADVIVRGPLDAFAEAASRGTMVCCDDMANPIGAGLNHRCLTDDERTRFGDRVKGLNSGFFMAQGDRLGDWLASWERIQVANLHVPGEGFCQAGLNACSLRALIPTTRLDGKMWFPKCDRDAALCDDDAPLVHFHGIGRRLRRYWRMRWFLARELRRRRARRLVVFPSIELARARGDRGRARGEELAGTSSS